MIKKNGQRAITTKSGRILNDKQTFLNIHILLILCDIVDIQFFCYMASFNSRIIDFYSPYWSVTVRRGGGWKKTFSQYIENQEVKTEAFILLFIRLQISLLCVSLYLLSFSLLLLNAARSDPGQIIMKECNFAEYRPCPLCCAPSHGRYFFTASCVYESNSNVYIGRLSVGVSDSRVALDILLLCLVQDVALTIFTTLSKIP